MQDLSNAFSDVSNMLNSREPEDSSNSRFESSQQEDSELSRE